MDSLTSIEDKGYAIIHGVFNDSELDSIILQLNESLKNSNPRSMKSRDGTVYAARNIFDVFPLTAQTNRHLSINGCLLTCYASMQTTVSQ